jgi:Transposase
MNPGAYEAFAAFVGLDWADATHEGCLQAAGSTKRECLSREHTPEASDAWVRMLRTRFNGQPVAIGLERAKGPLVSALRQYAFRVLFPITPLTLARYRAACTPRRAKDDPTDAELPLELLLTHPDKRQPLTPQSPTMRALAPLVAHRRRVVGDKVRITNRLTSTLKNDFPHVLHWFQDKDTTLFCDFLSRWPTLKAVQLARRSTLETFFRGSSRALCGGHGAPYPGHHIGPPSHHQRRCHNSQCAPGPGSRRPPPRHLAGDGRLRHCYHAARPAPSRLPALPGAPRGWPCLRPQAPRRLW